MHLSGAQRRRDLGLHPSGAAIFPDGSPNRWGHSQRLDIGALSSWAPKPWPQYLAACSARSVSQANWSVPKKSTRQGGFSRSRGPRPSSPPGNPPNQASARHPGLGLRPAPPPAGRGPQQRRTSTHIFAGWPTSRRRVGVRVQEPGPRGGV